MVINSPLGQRKYILTGDVHHLSLRTTDQKSCKPYSEVDLCSRYLEIANHNDITPVIFLTGKAVREEGHKVAQLLRQFSFDIGGHSYFANSPRAFYSTYRRIRGSPMGPKHWQSFEIHLTKKVIRRRLGIDIDFWRGHAYTSDRYTVPLLLKNRVSFVSNVVDRNSLLPRRLANGMTCLDINATVDHENLRHHNPGSGMSILQWKERVILEINDIMHKGGMPVLLIHPSCMFIEDAFISYSAICQHLRTTSCLSRPNPLVQSIDSESHMP